MKHSDEMKIGRTSIYCRHEDFTLHDYYLLSKNICEEFGPEYEFIPDASSQEGFEMIKAPGYERAANTYKCVRFSWRPGHESSNTTAYTGHGQFEEFKDDHRVMFPMRAEITINGRIFSRLVMAPYTKLRNAPPWSKREMDMIDAAFVRSGFTLKKKYRKKDYA